MQPLFLINEYILYLLKAKNGGHGVHSDFVFKIYERVIRENKNYYEFQPIELLRLSMLNSDNTIEVIDYGAKGGNKKLNHENIIRRKIKDIARLSSVTPKKGRLLFRLVNFIQPKVMVELGTSLGISTLYQRKACPEALFYTLEGSPRTSETAAENFNKMKASGIIQIVGNFEHTLTELIELNHSVDYVFFDGNHRLEATIDYFRRLMTIASENTVFVFDDIRWSPEMYDAWKIIINENKATVTVDLFSIGLVFFRKFQEKEHFVLRF